MSNEEKKKYLNRYRESGRKIINLQEELQAIREVEQSAKIQQLSDMPKGSSRQRAIIQQCRSQQSIPMAS